VQPRWSSKRPDS